jgi:hypothetical protein
MSWSDFFPILEDQSSEETEIHLDGTSFHVARVINPRDSSHIIATSLYCGDRCSSMAPRSSSQKNVPAHIGCAARSGLHLVVEGTRRIARAQEHPTVRVYLDADLEHLVPSLVEAGCEVALMRSTSKGCCIGSMWRYLALEEEGKYVTVVDAEEFPSVEYHAYRTEIASQAGLSGWRIPCPSSESDFDRGVSRYRPINTFYFGARGGFPISALISSAITGASSNEHLRSVAAVNRSLLIRNDAYWPKPGFDEWFLTIAVYPRMAQGGVLTFLSDKGGTPCQSLLLDIEYAAWGNPNSEVVVFQNPRTHSHGVPHGYDRSATETIKIRDDCRVLIRRRARSSGSGAGSVCDIPGAIEIHGSGVDALTYASANVSSVWWADLNRSLRIKDNASELFLDERLQRADLAVASWFFVSLDSATREWAISNGGNRERWTEGCAKKVPNLESAMVFWKSSSARSVLADWKEMNSPVRLEIYLALLHETGRFTIAELSILAQGWTL